MYTRFLLPIIMALTLAVGACTATATPHDTEAPPPEKPTTAEILRGLQPALDGMAESADDGVFMAVRSQESTACIILAGAGSTARTLSAAFGSLNPVVGAKPLCVIPGVDVDLSACDDMIDYVPLLEAEAVAEVDRILAPSVPIVRGILQTTLALTDSSPEVAAWVDAGFAYFDNLRAESARYLAHPDGKFKLPPVAVAGCETTAAPPGQSSAELAKGDLGWTAPPGTAQEEDSMNYLAARRRGADGPWHFTCKNDGRVRPVGYCAQGGCDHATPEEAQACYRRYLLDNRLRLDGTTTAHQRCRAPDCSELTDRFAEIDMQTWPLCDAHRSREVVEQLFPEVGEIWSS